MIQSSQLKAVYQRVMVLQQRANTLPDSQQALLSQALEELQAVLAELQASEEELYRQNEALISTRQAVDAERQRYQELFEFAPDGYLVTDANGKIQEANQAIALLLNVSQQFMVGKPLLIFIEPSDRSRFHLTLDRLEKVGKLQDWEIHLCSPRRSIFDAALTVTSVRDAEGRVASLRWMVRDTTERKQVERLLEHLNAELERQVQERTTQLQQALRFEAGLKRVTDKVRDSLDEGQILQSAVQELALVLNLVCCDTALYDSNHDLGLATSTVRYEFTTSEAKASPSSLGQVIPMTTLPETYRQLLQGEYFQFCEIASRHLAVLSCPIADDQGVLGDLWLFKRREDAFDELEIRLVQQVANQCAIAIRQAQLHQASQVQLEEMKKLDQLKDSFLSTTSHELRSPVATMRMAIRVLRLALAQERAAASARTESANTEATRLEKAGAVDRYLHILDTECDREISMINNLLDFQRLEAGEHPLFMQSIDLQDWLPEVVALFQERARDRQQTLHLDLPLNLPHLISDCASLERILVELLNNACKYTPLKGQITVRVQAESGSIQIVVSNTSLEIPASDLTHIFDKFYRIPNSDPWKQGGTGLGLALVQKLTERLDGAITVESTSGQIHFTVSLPMMGQVQ
ncbi:MAG: PAS domain-containing protein [Drouetiella hepatica Uher 2000/2452]|jgi:PAS domain S-box-containing protein|uniref:histidine kinase n=1 Tax=Drouetiella hepatica Uher 2000/2452 TaxID=904376 RepID=A0A951Q817_9CYAN|nr:PAS domain-containing protein [Drouetiella hepatica Uher 2000/2452]